MAIEIINGEEWDVTTTPSGHIVKTIHRPAPPVVETRLTRLQFQLRFTFDELVAIETAAETTPGVRVLQNQQLAAEYIDLVDENTILGVMYLHSIGLLTADRANAILSV